MHFSGETPGSLPVCCPIIREGIGFNILGGRSGPMHQIGRFVYFSRISNPRGSISAAVLQSHPAEFRE